MATKFDKQGIYVKDGAECAFNYRTSIGPVDKMNFVEAVVKLIVTDTYEYVIRDMMFNYMLIRVFTDVDCTEIDECENGNVSMMMVEDLVYGTTIVDTIKYEMINGLLDELNKGIDYTIEYRTGIRINPVENALAELLDMITNKLATYDVDAMSGAAKVVSSLNGTDFNVDKLLAAYAGSDVFKKQQELALNASAERTQKIEEIAAKE